MLIIVIFSLFCIEALIGFLALDLLWQTRGTRRLLLKASVSIGLGMGGSSLAYFLYLILFAGRPYFIYFELLFLLILFWIWYRRNQEIHLPHLQKLTLLQMGIVLLAVVVFFSSLFGLASYALARQEGDWDAWMIYNRSARFIYRGAELWQNTFSNEIDTFFHPDYPPMLALNIASIWDTVNTESRYVPMIQGLFFSIACVLVLVSALASLKSFAQAGLGLIFLWGAGNFFVYEGGRQTADIPIAFLC